MSVGGSSVRSHLRRMAAAYLALAISLVPTLFVYFRAKHNVRERERVHFEENIRTVSAAVVSRLESSLAVLRGTKGLFVASPHVGPREWTNYVLNSGLRVHLPRIVSLGFIQRVRQAETNQHVNFMRNAGMAEYRLSVNGAREEYFPIVYLHSSSPAAGALVGTDLSEHERRLSAMQLARRTGTPVATGKLPLLTPDDSKGAGFDIYLAVYRWGENPKTEQEREAALHGFVFASFSTTKLLEEIFGRNVKPAIDFEIYDGKELTPETLLYDANGVLNRAGPSGGPRLTREVSVAALGHEWTWCFSTLPQFHQTWQHAMPLLALIGGLIVSGCLFGLALSQTKARMTLEGVTANLSRSEHLLLRANQDLETKVREAETAKEQLQNARDYAQSLIDSSLDMIISVDAERRILEFNSAAQAAFGYTKEEVLGQHADVLYADKAQGDEVVKIIQKMGNFSGEVLNRRKDGSTFYSLLTAAPLRDRGGRVIGVIGISRDFTQRKCVEQALAAEKERLAVTLRSIGDGVITTDTQGKISLVNRAAEMLTGWQLEEAIGRPLDEVFHILDEQTRQRAATPVERILTGGEIFGQASDRILVAKDGTERLISNTGAPMRDSAGHLIGVVLVFRDIAEKRRLEAELSKASKIESLGLLAGGIAHDFNNILTGILGNVSLAKTFSVHEKDVQERLAQAEKACLRARDLTQQLLTFAKGGAPIKKIHSMIGLVRESAEFALRGSNVRCEISHPPDLWAVEVDEGQMTQVLHNLVINASEAMPEGGVIRIQTENVLLNGESPLPLPSGRYVRTVVKDQGTGIRPEHLPRIFDPYFSTKQRGSGLGLATAYSIVKKHSGTITVQSQLGVGTVFELYLPACDRPVPREDAAPEMPRGGEGRILVMDDENLILELADTLLRRLGYDVVQARDGKEAIELFREAHCSGEPFAAVIMDLTIPGGLGGKETIKRLQAIDPEVRAIVSSGYSNDPVMANYAEHGFAGVVIKPYQIADLARTLDRVLREPAPRTCL